jgi:hypothetical protein
MAFGLRKHCFQDTFLKTFLSSNQTGAETGRHFHVRHTSVRTQRMKVDHFGARSDTLFSRASEDHVEMSRALTRVAPGKLHVGRIMVVAAVRWIEPG